MELITGDIDKLKLEACKLLSTNIDSDNEYKVIGKSISKYSGLFKTTHFDNIFYFASNDNNYVEDIWKFLELVSASKQQNVLKYIYIISGDEFNVEENNERINFIEEIFNSYRKKYNCNILLVNIPCIYSSNYIAGKVRALIDNKEYGKLKFSYSRNYKVGYIHIEDLAKLLFYLKSHKLEESSYLKISSKDEMTLEQLVKLIQSKNNIKVIYGDKTNNEKDDITEFDFINHVFADDIKNCTFFKKIKRLSEHKSSFIGYLSHTIFKFIEVFLLSFLAHYMCSKFTIMPQLQNIDIRLILIVVISLYYELHYSLLVAMLMCLSFVTLNLTSLSDFSVIISNTNNWIVFIIYFTVAIVVNERLYRVKKKLNMEKEKNLTLVNNQQIDNFAIKHYEDVIMEANKLLILNDGAFTKIEKFIKNFIDNKCSVKKMYESYHDILGNDNVGLYEIKDNKLKLLNNKVLKTTIAFDKLDGISINEFISDKQKIWVNSDLEENRPSYLVPIYSNDGICAVLTIWSCSLEQMNIQYEKMLISINNILSDFIKARVNNK